MAQQTPTRREYLTLIGVGLIGLVAGCREGTTDSTNSNDIVIWVRDTDATATITVENSSTEAVLFEETDTFPNSCIQRMDRTRDMNTCSALRQSESRLMSTMVQHMNESFLTESPAISI